jgi:hypothetical protein
MTGAGAPGGWLVRWGASRAITTLCMAGYLVPTQHPFDTRLPPCPCPPRVGFAVLRRHFPCEHGCTVELGADVPAYVMDANQTLHKYCLITQARCA